MQSNLYISILYNSITSLLALTCSAQILDYGLFTTTTGFRLGIIEVLNGIDDSIGGLSSGIRGLGSGIGGLGGGNWRLGSSIGGHTGNGDYGEL